MIPILRQRTCASATSRTIARTSSSSSSSSSSTVRTSFRNGWRRDLSTQDGPAIARKALDKSSFQRPKFDSDLEAMGATKNMRILIYAFISIYGTLETYMYCRWIYGWLTGATEEVEDEDDSRPWWEKAGRKW